MQPNEEFKPLMDAIYRDKVRRARAEKVPGVLSLDGFELFAGAFERMREGVRFQFPDYDETQVEAELRRRLDIKRRLDDRGIYQSVAP